MRQLGLTIRSAGHFPRTGGEGTFALLGVVLVVLSLAVAMDRSDYDIWGAFWVGPVLALLTLPIARNSVKRSGDPGSGRLIMLAFAVKVLGGSIARYITVYGLYDGIGDATAYDRVGRMLAPLLRQGIYDDLGKVTATRFIGILTGHVYGLTGPTRLGGFLVFSWIAFVGLWLLTIAFETALPQGDHKRYQKLVLFFPSMIFWPSSIGKDAWMIFCLGLAAYGIALLVSSRFGGLVPMLLGLWGAAVVRPHVALLIVLAAGIGAALSSLSPRLPRHLPGGRIRSLIVTVVIIGSLFAVIGQAEEFLKIDQLDPDSAQSVRTSVNERTGQGGSEFDAPPFTSPSGLLLSVPTVLARPFPFEATNGVALAASCEGLVLLALIWSSLNRLGRLPAMIAQTPYVLIALLYVLGFVYAFSAIENFGILARQRAQLLPFVFVLLSLPRRADQNVLVSHVVERSPSADLFPRR